MATVKIKFRPSTVDGGQGVIFYQVIHNRVARQQKTGYRLYGYEWNNHLSEIVLPKFNESRKRYLSEIGDKIRMDIKFFQKIISSFEHSGCDYTADDVIAEFVTDNQENYLFSFMGGVISNLQTLGNTLGYVETAANFVCEAFQYMSTEPEQFHFIYPAASEVESGTLVAVQDGTWRPLAVTTVKNATIETLPSLSFTVLSAALELRIFDRDKTTP